jgi:hypothetical protein
VLRRVQMRQQTPAMTPPDARRRAPAEPTMKRPYCCCYCNATSWARTQRKHNEKSDVFRVVRPAVGRPRLLDFSGSEH